MSGSLGHPSHPVFMVDSSGNLPRPQQFYHQRGPGRHLEPPLVPCWTFPPARAKLKRNGWGGLSAGLLVLILLLVFAALGLGAYQIRHLQTQVERLTLEIPTKLQNNAPQKLVGLDPAEFNKKTKTTAAHLMGCADQNKSSGTLKWETKIGDVFTEGVKYSNGGLQVNETGLYFVYAHVEFGSNLCSLTDILAHIISLKRNNNHRAIMEDRQEGFCMEGRSDVWMIGSHLGSLQHLKESDWLFVNVSHAHLLSRHFHSNYFGLFKIH
ncbi:hypothetical protein DNTS_029288 [Danionella cerebrum]|uniref:THD domain-containing protein n=1 Tax=Danionella cerebrum TaxID=2873325 RepID=A0A553RP36_9TELE|nr:hypothetical protein DNTS_032423 [Danionella translucida]TRZ03945.1 hypothetical protein DNTS_029288 [Danionella translucida]